MWVSPKRDFLCSGDFEDNGYETSPTLLVNLGMSAKRQYLKPGAVRSIFSEECEGLTHVIVFGTFILGAPETLMLQSLHVELLSRTRQIIQFSSRYDMRRLIVQHAAH